MAVAIILLAVIALISTVVGISYRQQIKSISRQLNFLKKHETNMIVTGSCGRHSITELIDEINDFLADTAKSKKEYMDKQNNLKGTITNLSHDIRTPLTSLNGYFQLLSKCDNPAEHKRYLEIIENRITCLKDMIEELFMYAKLQNDSYEIKLERCCLNQILLKSTFSFYHDFKAAGITSQVDICEEQLYVLGNEASLMRAFQNIIKNSLEHGHDSFKIRLERISEQINIIFSNKFTDNDKIDAEQVFDVFYKADSARSRTSTGLGLAIAKELILRMNGTVAANIMDDIFTMAIHLKAIT